MVMPVSMGLIVFLRFELENMRHSRKRCELPLGVA
jgi:hypothetical protein